MYFAAYNGAFLGQSLPPPTPPSRSVSYGPSDMSQPKPPVMKAKSTNSLRTLAAKQAADAKEAESAFHTIRDPRMASTSDLSRTSSSSRNGESKDEVAVLSDKLISAINHQQRLDDSLAEARHELEAANRRTAQLEAKVREYESRITSKELMTKESVEKQYEKVNADMEETNRQNGRLSQEKRSLQIEMENLSASLFEEANKMVATANEQKAATEKKNQQLRDQIKDGEAVIASQTEQLTELKLLMQDIGSEHRKELAGMDSPGVTPASPQVPKDENLARLLEAMNLSPITPDHPVIVPSPSTQLTHLIKPMCRTDIPSYDDFKLMLANSNPRSHTPSHAPSRAGSGSYGGLSGLGLGALSQNNSSSPNLSNSANNSKLAASPGLPGSFSPAPDQKGPQPLKDTRFFKRIMVEDIEPTLRLDLSPQISWLQRRSILAAVSDSTLIVEPIPESSLKLYGKYTSCSICGENRKEGQNPRTHAMRTREGEGANKWAVCKLCLEKVRAVGDIIGYVRMVRDGVVKIADLQDEHEAWEEIIRLRERLFWARLAGGVVPAFVPSNKVSPVTVRQESPAPVLVAATKTEESNKENETPGFSTPPEGSRRGSEEDTTQTQPRTDADSKSEQEANTQLQSGLDDSLTTFENARERALANAKQAGPGSPTSTPPTPSRHSKRESGGGGFPRISIPRLPSMPQGFWETQGNVLH
ncbi:rab guanine nucleotide exchange factor S2 [Knufia obscura]|uniref:Rab guanine nucleotide exchange factor S2 n=2 Tax=Knufia TaxID=430999 RepID=A0AAN8F3T9_9EURO|nr:rab guanine nucleotide exchange factor S2 [Knufia obscura]KAK5950681.1 rab guanine nucleotide exchange factor S2 [Knufia fluminis]